MHSPQCLAIQVCSLFYSYPTEGSVLPAPLIGQALPTYLLFIITLSFYTLHPFSLQLSLRFVHFVQINMGSTPDAQAYIANIAAQWDELKQNDLTRQTLVEV